MKIEIDFGRAARATHERARAVVSASPVRVDSRAAVYMTAGAAASAGLAALAAPAAVCVGCAATAGAVHGAAVYGLTRAIERKSDRPLVPTELS